MRRFIEDANARPQIWNSVQFTSKLAYSHSISQVRRPNKRDKVWKNANPFFLIFKWIFHRRRRREWSLAEFPSVFQWTEKMTDY